jgi:hypothetical protein
MWETENLDEHVALIKRQVDRSLEDDETIQLARKIVSGNADGEERGRRFVRAWGKKLTLPPAQCPMRTPDTEEAVARCEMTAIWNFGVANVRYVEDPDGYDLFGTVRYILEAGAGDCDDSTILYAALHKAVGFRNVRARVVSTDGKFWEHVYVRIGVPKSRARELVALDPTVKGAVPGWEYPRSKTVRDFIL